MVDLLVLTSLNKLTSRLKKIVPFVTKQPTLIRRSNVLSLSLQLVFLDFRNYETYLSDIFCF